MMRRLLLICLLAFVPAVAAAAQPATSAAFALPIRLNEVDLQGNWVEIYNGNDQAIDVGGYALCRGDFCKKLAELPALYGRVAMQPETYVVLAWDPHRDADADPLTPDGEVALYVAAPYDDAAHLLDYMAFGAPQPDGRAPLAAEAGHWRTGDAAPVPPAGQTLSFFGGAERPVRNWGAGSPTPSEFNMKVATSLDAADEVVGAFLLTPAYPNPFNPRTQFGLTVAQTQKVLIEVYNLLGRRVDVLHDGALAGQTRHTFLFDADDLPSGLYLIRVVGEHFTTTQRVTLLK